MVVRSIETVEASGITEATLQRILRTNPRWADADLRCYVLDDRGSSRYVVAPADAIIQVGDEVRCLGSWAVSTQSVEISEGRVTAERRAEFAERLEVVS